MAGNYIKSRHAYRLSKGGGSGTLVMCKIHGTWYPERVRGRHGEHAGQCQDCRQDQQSLFYTSQHLGIPYGEATLPENLARIEAHCGRALKRYHQHGG